ncbi:hypothetical protein [Methylosinus sporium]|uniref:Tetratricopeptide repeat protein n=1 Tax=Methylosinus sporium TaxID=428 RepID=A0A2U1SVI2_METSR|nr:hypothetical protein [Methylosinus sporium]PWB95617.1 hypothetical protein C5689_00395 [Methylosinus sporium]
MIRRRTPHVCTSLTGVVLCLLTISQSARLLRYAVAEATLNADEVGEELTPFSNDPMVGYLARAKSVELDKTGDAARRAEQFTALLLATPLNSNAWLGLAAARLELGASNEKILSALAMSYLSAPHEARLMAERAVFALPLWPVLPPASRSALIGDLTGGWWWIGAPRRVALRASLALAKSDTREDLSAALLLTGKQGAAIAAELGVEVRRAH